jgi:hypothetical protein
MLRSATMRPMRSSVEMDGVVAHEVQDLHLRRYNHDELRGLLTGAGFVNIDACGDYNEETPVATARTWLCFSGQRQGGST